MDGNKVNQKTFSAGIFVMMKSHKSENVDLLKKELFRGKLGKFKVAAFPDIVDGRSPT